MREGGEQRGRRMQQAVSCWRPSHELQRPLGCSMNGQDCSLTCEGKKGKGGHAGAGGQVLIVRGMSTPLDLSASLDAYRPARFGLARCLQDGCCRLVRSSTPHLVTQYARTHKHKSCLAPRLRPWTPGPGKDGLSGGRFFARRACSLLVHYQWHLLEELSSLSR